MAVNIDDTPLIDKNNIEYKEWLEKMTKKPCVLNEMDIEKMMNLIKIKLYLCVEENIIEG